MSALVARFALSFSATSKAPALRRLGLPRFNVDTAVFCLVTVVATAVLFGQ